MKAILITGCGCSKMIEIEKQVPEIRLPVKLYDPNEITRIYRDGVVPTDHIVFHDRRFRLVDKYGEFPIYREG